MVFRLRRIILLPFIIILYGSRINLTPTGWTARASVHWIVSIIGIVIYAGSAFIVFQCIFVYIPLSYPQYAASLFAGNDFSRSAFAFGAILFSRPMYINLGVDKGITLLAGLSVLGVVSALSSLFSFLLNGQGAQEANNERFQIGMFVLYFYGANLRARSRFAVSG